jgi:hypothetical protein
MLNLRLQKLKMLYLKLINVNLAYKFARANLITFLLFSYSCFAAQQMPLAKLEVIDVDKVLQNHLLQDPPFTLKVATYQALAFVQMPQVLTDLIAEYGQGCFGDKKEFQKIVLVKIIARERQGHVYARATLEGTSTWEDLKQQIYAAMVNRWELREVQYTNFWGRRESQASHDVTRKPIPIDRMRLFLEQIPQSKSADRAMRNYLESVDDYNALKNVGLEVEEVEDASQKAVC